MPFNFGGSESQSHNVWIENNQKWNCEKYNYYRENKTKTSMFENFGHVTQQ